MVTRRRFSRNAHKVKLSRRVSLESALYAEVERILKENDPTIQLPAVRVASRLAAVIASQLASQTQVIQRSMLSLEADATDFANDFVADVVGAATQSVRKKLKRFRPEAIQEDTLQLADDWAGTVAGPTLIERHYGIPRSTLYRWQKLNEVVAISSRTSRKPVFPLKQFVDGRPVNGVADVVSIFGDQRRAWQWLVTKNTITNGAPIDALLRGEVESVVKAAQSGE
jgi:hypothetical protein